MLQSIPVAFLKYLDGETCNDALLRSCRGKLWRVKINNLSFEEGWEDFARDHDLRVGDFLVFRYEEGMVFNVMVFDPNACERDYPRLDFKVDDQMKEKGSKVAKVKDFKSITKTRQPMAGPKMKDKACSFSHGHPRFVITVKPFNLENSEMVSGEYTHTLISQFCGCSKAICVLTIPCDFARTNRLTNKCSKMTIRDRKGRSWPVTLRKKKFDGRVYIGCGWRQFSVANCLKLGDVCAFELILGEDIMIFHRL
ncbi:hypothetical protein HHK36_025409 [Tetracentron sinense]|uniref:TF-B3 domain-containing protein n=1 Tax=Tetracentron sinense TaxID=13715 RepID=A0A835D6D0_TETSI|nr:hypothetical protein HHK36_025409 [Tetracentron sinense]